MTTASDDERNLPRTGDKGLSIAGRHRRTDNASTSRMRLVVGMTNQESLLNDELASEELRLHRLGVGFK